MPYQFFGGMNPNAQVGSSANASSASPWLNAALSAVQLAMQGNPAERARRQYAEQYGIAESRLPSTPGQLSQANQANQLAGETALNFVPYAGAALSSAASSVNQKRNSRAMKDYLAKLMEANPALRGLDLQNPQDAMQQKSTLLGDLFNVYQPGQSTGQAALTGASRGASVGTTIMPGIGTAIGAGAGALRGMSEQQRATGHETRADIIDPLGPAAFEIALGPLTGPGVGWKVGKSISHALGGGPTEQEQKDEAKKIGAKNEEKLRIAQQNQKARAAAQGMSQQASMGRPGSPDAAAFLQRMLGPQLQAWGRQVGTPSASQVSAPQTQVQPYPQSYTPTLGMTSMGY